MQRFLADAGIAARRVCEELIQAGRVEVNGRVERELPVFVDPRADRVEVDGRLVPRAERRVYLMVHKPARMLVTTADEPGLDRATILELVDHPSKPRLFPVGRLDFETTGLVLLTNDGAWANRLTHPRHGVPKTYLVVVKGEMNEGFEEGFDRERKRARRAELAAEARERGVRMGTLRAARGGREAGGPRIRVVKAEAGKTLLEVTLVEGGKQDLGSVLARLGRPIRKITRVAIGPIELRGLSLGKWRELTREEMQSVRVWFGKQGKGPGGKGGGGGAKREVATSERGSGGKRRRRGARAEEERVAGSRSLRRGMIGSREGAAGRGRGKRGKGRGEGRS